MIKKQLPKQRWQRYGRAGFILLAILFILWGVTPPAQAAPANDGIPISRFLNEDGTLNLPEEGVLGSIDPTGFQMVSAPGKAPRFVPAVQAAQVAGSAWSALGSGMDNNVRDLVWDGTNLYAGGNFTSAGGVANTTYIAKWDGSAWSALGSGLNGGVEVMLWDGTNLYVGGHFTTAGGVSANRIAKWDGSTWSALGSGMNFGVYALAWDGINLYAGGAFTTAGGMSTNYIAKWDGSTWSALGSGLNSGVNFLLWDGTNLYVGGNFTSAGGVANTAYIAKWDGSAWSALGSGMNNFVFVLARDGANNLYAGGLFTTAGGVSANRIAKWDGSTWSALGSGMNDYVSDLLWDGTNLYAGGNFTSAGGVNANYIAKWDGTNWSALGSGMNNAVYDLAWDGTNLYAGGIFTTAGGVSANYIAKWASSALNPCEANVAETGQYSLVYQLDIPVNVDYNGALPAYSVDNSAAVVAYDRVGYCLELDGNWVWVSMDDFTGGNAQQTGVPVSSVNPGGFQQTVSNMTVDSNVAGVTTGTNITTGNIEFWHNCYQTPATLGLPGANDTLYDYDDSIDIVSFPNDCYGSMQVHNYGAGETVFAFNRWEENLANDNDLGIGNNTGTHPDWTFQGNAGSYITRTLYVYVREAFVWDGGGADNNWSTALNWDNDIVPGAGDTVVFNGTSSKDSVIDPTFGGAVVNVDISNAYAGTITFGRSLAVSNNYSQDGGTVVVDLTHAFTVDGSFTHTGGTLQETNTVGASSTVNFLQIRDSGNTTDKYRGVDLDTTSNGNDLGSTTVSIRAVNTAAGAYCTSTGASSPPYAGRCFSITPTNNLAAHVTLWALTSEVPGAVTSSSVYRYNAGAWQEVSNISTGISGSYTWTAGDTPGFSSFLVAQAGGGGGAPTAVSLQTFSAATNSMSFVLVLVVMLVGLGTAFLLIRRRTQ